MRDLAPLPMLRAALDTAAGGALQEMTHWATYQQGRLDGIATAIALLTGESQVMLSSEALTRAKANVQ